jgi:hypothetical protein
LKARGWLAGKMPLHLLSKKSWNVYAPDNIARVKRDQAEAQRREEEEERRFQEEDAARRVALLRGEQPALAPAHARDADVDVKRKTSDARDQRDDRRKRRRVAGEDDTDRDLRLAREDIDSKHRQKHPRSGDDAPRRRSNAPITDHHGHINLFPIDDRSNVRGQKNAEREAEKARKQRESEDQYTMRFSNAAGKNGGLESGPWYAKDKSQRRADMDFVEGKDVWGRPDPAATQREQARTTSNDPLAFMQRAQSQLKRAEMDKKRWHEHEQDGSIRRPKHRVHGEREEFSNSDGHRYGSQRKHHSHPSSKEHRPSREGHRPRLGDTASRKHRPRHDHASNRRESLPDVTDDFKLDV